jgi:hypothetical protein
MKSPVSARAALAVPILLLCSTLVPAQVEATLARQLTLSLELQPPGVVSVNDLTIRKTSPGHAFVGMPALLSWTSPYNLLAFDYDLASHALTPRTDCNSIASGVQEASMSANLREIAVFMQGAGPGIRQRASVGSPWSSLLPIQGLPANRHGLQFCRIGGVNSLVACKGAPNSGLEVYDYDDTSVRVNNPRVLAPPLGAANNFVAFVIPLEDDDGETRGFVACIRQMVGLPQQFVHCGGVEPTSHWSVFFNTPPNSFFVGGDQLAGGHLVAANAGLPGALPNGSINVVGAFTFESRASALGGWTDLTMMGPPGDIGVIGIAGGLGTPFPVPGFSNLLGLDPALMVAVFAYVMHTGVAQHDFVLGPTSPFVWPIQGASMSFTAFLNVLANTEGLGVY